MREDKYQYVYVYTIYIPYNVEGTSQLSVPSSTIKSVVKSSQGIDYDAVKVSRAAHTCQFYNKKVRTECSENTVKSAIYQSDSIRLKILKQSRGEFRPL